MLAPRDPSQAVPAAKLLSSLSGEYKLDQVHVYHYAQTTTGEYLGAFYGLAININQEPSPDMRFECRENASPTAFLSSARLNLPETLNASSGPADTVEDNVVFDSLGELSFIPGSDLSGGTHSGFTHMLNELSPDAKLFWREDGKGFEIRFQREEIRNAESAAELKATITALITYRASEGQAKLSKR